MKKVKRWLHALFTFAGEHSPTLLQGFARLDIKLGATGYSAILTDILAQLGRVELARALIIRILFELLESTKPRMAPRTGSSRRTRVQHLKVSQFKKAEALERITQNLEQHGVRPFLAFGTLLGMVREQRFMPHDGDMDLGVLTTEATAKSVKPLFEELGFQTTRYEQDNEVPWPCRLKVQNDEGIKIDVVFFHPIENHFLTYCTYCGQTLIRNRTPFDLTRVDFLGVSVWIPELPERFLTENYGDWQHQADFYHFIISSNLTDHTLDVVKYCSVRTLYRLLTLGEYDKAQGLIDQMLKRNTDMKFWMDISDKFTTFVAKI